MPRFSAICIALLGALTLAACFGPAKDTHPNQVLTKRNALFKQFTRTLEPMVVVTNGRGEYDKETFLALAQDLEKLSTKPWSYFPQDGNYPPTRARPEVWSNPAEFKQAQEKYRACISALVNAAQGDNLDKVKLAVAEVTSSCKSCHKQFRFE